MDLPQSESRPDETTPLLTPATNDRDVAEESPSPTINHDAEGTNAVERPTRLLNHKLLISGLTISLVVAITALAFLFYETKLDWHGQLVFDYWDWRMGEFRRVVFWTCIISMVFSISNIICLGRTRKPFPAVINAIVLGAFTFAIFVGVSEVVEETPPTRCRALNPPDTLPDNPEDPFLRATGLLEQCQEWALKIQTMREITIYATAFYGVILGVLFITILYDAIRITTHFFRTVKIGPRFGPSQVGFEVAFRWGSPQRRDTTQRQFDEEVAASE
ncbi:hypothetical protein EDB80DRAFT_725163 [Ilyonectria destructans]|nr:hypothetical protein EDB80DRAFT_725163 [Ilyonectria destructans]